jgi:hypothetical protein
MIHYLFEFDDWIVGAAIVCLYLITALFLAGIALWPPIRTRMKIIGCATQDLLFFLGVLFSLSIGFLAVEIEDRIEKAASALSVEGNSLRGIASILRVEGPEAAKVRAAARCYLEASIKLEISGSRMAIEYSTASQKMEELGAAAAALAESGRVSEPVRNMILQLALQASDARARRVGLMHAEPNGLKWALLLYLLFSIQLSVVLIHGADPRRMIVHLVLISLAGSLSIAAAALTEDPFTQPRMVSITPLEAALEALSKVDRQ